MNVRDVAAKVDQVRRAAAQGDHEKAHGLRDNLFAEVLIAIADGYRNPEGLACEALETEKISFNRWCA